MRVEYHRLFRKKWKKCSPKLQDSFYSRLQIFMINKFDPILNNHALTGEYLGKRSVNITGDYRAIFVENNGDVKFFDFDTHHNLYGT